MYFTKNGDAGESGIQGARLKKSDVVFDAIGDVDELNAALGVALSFVADGQVRQELVKQQHVLFTVGAELSRTANVAVSEVHVVALEKAVHIFAENITQQKTFLLPNGTKAASFLHLARAVCRRAERSCRKLHEQRLLNDALLRYLNRLSSLLFVLARYENRTVEEVAPKY